MSREFEGARALPGQLVHSNALGNEDGVRYLHPVEKSSF
jgi:hypothetical protein